jgi:hypothetical protein
MLARRHCRPSRARKSSASFAAPVFSARRRALRQFEVRGCFHIPALEQKFADGLFRTVSMS